MKTNRDLQPQHTAHWKSRMANLHAEIQQLEEDPYDLNEAWIDAWTHLSSPDLENQERGCDIAREIYFGLELYREWRNDD